MDAEIKSKSSITTGTVTANAGTNLNTSGLATSVKQSDGSQKTQLVDSSGTEMTALGKVVIGNARNKFKDNFVTASPDLTIWDLVNDSVQHIVNGGGDAISSSYLRISLSPLLTDSGVSITTKSVFSMPFRMGVALSASQRILGQEIGIEMVGVDSNNVVDNMSSVADKAITGTTISITTNVGTVTLTGHGLKGGDRVCINGCPDPRLNVAPVLITVLTADTFTVPITLANGSYNCTGGQVKWIDPVLYAKNAASCLLENTTVTNASFITRRNGASARGSVAPLTIATTTASQGQTSPYTDAFLAAGQQEFLATLDSITYRSFAPDSIATMSSLNKRTQGTPDEEVNYKIRIRAKNLKSFTVPVARITAISKTGTTTATVTTDTAHGLTTADYIQIYGVADITNFPNLTAQTVVSSVIDPNNFTVIIGGVVTASSAGGVVWKVQGSTLAPGVLAQNIQSISRTNNILSVVGNTTWATPLPGEYFDLYGMNGSASVYDGAYKVLRVNTSTLELESTGANFGSISCGGAVIRRTDVRVHYVRLMDYTRLVTEIVGGRGNTTDINDAVPVALTGGTVTTVTTVTTVSDTTRLNALGTTAASAQNPLYTLVYANELSTWQNMVRSRIT